MAHYVDTSAFVKLVVRERHSAALRAWAEAHDGAIFSSDLLRTEALRAARHHSPEALAATRTHMEALTIVVLTTEVFERAAELDPAILHSLDALHLAAALSAGPDLEGVVTYDERLAAAAALHGVAAVSPR